VSLPVTPPASAAASSPTAAKSERRGPALEVLRELLADGHTDAVIALFAKLVARNGELERKLADLLSRGRKNEGVSSAQLLLLIEGLAGQPTPAPDVAEADAKLSEAAALEPKPDPNEVKPKRQPPLRKPLPAHLRRVENPIAVPETERPCPRCGGLRTCIGHDVTEVLDLIPAEVVVRVDKQEKLACVDCEAEVVRAPPGDKIVPGGRVGTSLVAQLLVDKYRDGLPLHRQKERFARLGLPVAVSTLADQVAWAAEALHPVWQEARRQVLAAEVMNFDGTGIAVRDSSRPDGIRLGTFWGAVGDDEVALYLYASTGKQHGQREGEMGPAEFLARRVGRTVVDAAPLFDTSFKRAGLVECGCNTHSRRYFRKALAAGDSRAALPLAAFKKLYDIEEEVRGREPEEIRLERQTRSTPLYDELESWCRVRQPHEPPSSALGKAIGYLLNNVVPLRRFLDDGVIPIDNGAVERLHVRTALTRKNFLFAGSDTGAERAAVVYSVLGCCALLDINPVEYLADVLPRLSRRLRLADVPGLMPAQWKAAREAAAAPSATVPA
jgi:transposase